MNKAFVHVMVDATWIWDSTLSRMDWANKEGLEFIGIKDINDLQKIRYNEDLPWVYQLNCLSKEALPDKGTMEKISFPGDVVLNCWVKNHEIEEGHPGLWIILKEDHKLEQSYKDVEPHTIPSPNSVEAEETVSEKPVHMQKEDSSQHDEGSPVFKRPTFLASEALEKQAAPLKKSQKPDIEIKLKPTTIVQDQTHETDDKSASDERAELAKSQETRTESNKILALIARQINAKTGLSYGKRKNKPDQEQTPAIEPTIQPNIARSVSDYVGADKSAVAAASQTPTQTPKTEPVEQNGKMALPGMAELMKQMKNAGDLTSEQKPLDEVNDDTPKSAAKPVDAVDFVAEPLNSMPPPIQDAEIKNIVQSVSNSEGIHDVKRVSDKDEGGIKPLSAKETSDEKMSVVAAFMAKEVFEKEKKTDKAKQAVLEKNKNVEKSKKKSRKKRVAAAQPKTEKTVAKAQSIPAPKSNDNAAKRDTKVMAVDEQADQNMHEFPVASAMANKDGKFIAASELFSLAMGYRDEAEFLKEAEFETILPAIYQTLIKGEGVKGEGRKGATNFFENSAGLTKSGRRMKLSLSAKTSTTQQGITHFMVLYPTGVAFPQKIEEPLKTVAPTIEPTSVVTAPPQADSSEAKADGANLKDDYERTLPFLAKISHEIRTPLNSIIGFSELMKEEQFGPVENERYLGYMEDIFVSANHALSLVNDMLDISRIQAGSMEIERETLDLNEHVQSAIKSMAPQFASKDIHVWQGLSDKQVRVVCDKRNLRQIVLNLVSNAVKYTPQGGQITISTALEKNGQVVLRVRDTGIGMSETDIKQAMKPFQRLDTILRHETNGSGLGLPLTKALIEANKATFKIESAVDKGTVASVLFSQ